MDREHAPSAAQWLRARWIVPRPDRVIADGALRVVDGRIVALGPASEVPLDGAEPIDLGDVALTPGLVDAHAHLCLTDLAGRVRAGATFVDWIRELMAQRSASPALDLAAVVRDGLDRLAASGCVAVGDVVGAAELAPYPRRLARAPLVVAHAEVLDAGDDARGRERIDAALAALGASSANPRAGVSPHAPYTVSDATLVALARALAGRGATALQFHWAETEEERDWTDGRGGPFEALLGPAQARGPALARLERAGLLGPRTTLVHGNHPQNDEPERIAAADASLVHCPGAHAFFDRAPFDVERYRRAGVRLCLGTDSAAGNDALHMGRELALARAAFPHVPDDELWSWATSDGARALGLADDVGLLAPGRPFTAAAFAVDVSAARDVVPALVRTAPDAVAVWVEARSLLGGASVESAGGRSA